MNKRSLLSFWACLALSLSYSQLQEKWSVELPGELAWQKVTMSGSYLVATANGLYAYDQENGQQLWANETFAGHDETEIQELDGSPLLIARKGSEVSIFSPFDGTVKFNSTTAGIAELEAQTFLYKTNGIFIAGKDKAQEPTMLLVDNDNGQVRWQLNEKFGTIVSVNEISDTEMVITTLFQIYKMNSRTGDVIWQKPTTREAEQAGNSELAALFQDLASEMAKDFDFVIRYYQDLEKDVLVIASEAKHERPTGNDGVSISYTNSYNAYRISDGSMIWDTPVKMQGKLGDLGFHGDGVIVMPDDGNRTKINYYPFTTDATGAWGKKGNGTVIKGGVYDHLSVGKHVLLVTNSGSNTFLNMLDPSTGELTYDKPVKIAGKLVRTYNTDKGITYITTEELNILDPATGSQLLGKSIPTTPGLTTTEGDLIYVFDTKSSTVKSVDIRTAEVKDITSDKLKFDGKEDPTALEKREGGLLLTSDQNLALYDMAGNQQFNQYYKAPSESGLKKALLLAQAARAAYIGANAYVAAGALQSVTAEAKAEDPVSGAIVEGFGMAYQELGDQASDFAKRSVQQALSRSKATSQGRDFNILLAQTDNGNAIQRVNKDTGNADATIELGKEKDPKYAVDDVTGRIFVVNGSNAIACYQF